MSSFTSCLQFIPRAVILLILPDMVSTCIIFNIVLYIEKCTFNHAKLLLSSSCASANHIRHGQCSSFSERGNLTGNISRRGQCRKRGNVLTSLVFKV